MTNGILLLKMVSLQLVMAMYKAKRGFLKSMSSLYQLDGFKIDVNQIGGRRCMVYYRCLSKKIS